MNTYIIDQAYYYRLLSGFISLLFYTVQVQVPEKDKKLIQRYGHGAAAVTVNSDCVEVILFGGWKEQRGSPIADPVVVRFGKCGRALY